MKPSIVAVIPARFASTRFPGKPLTLIAGHPMIEWVYRRTSRARSVASVVVATDDSRIRKAVEAFGGSVVMTSRRHRSGTDRIAEVARQVRAPIIVNVQGDEPLIDPRAIDRAVEGLLRTRGRCPVATLKTPIRRRADLVDPNVVKVVADSRSEALYFSRSMIPHLRGTRPNQLDFSRQRTFFKHLGLYVYTRAFLLHWPELKVSPFEKVEALEQLRILENGYRIKVLETSFASPSVDIPEDVGVVEEEIARRKIKF
jgi:3-deoxy-manno-octulosonate cytidylyltransferase (CMP-KDO synthetase)